MPLRIRLREDDLVPVRVADDEHVHPGGLQELAGLDAHLHEGLPALPGVLHPEVDPLVADPGGLLVVHGVVQPPVSPRADLSA